MQDNNQKKKQRNKWLALINIPIQMGVVIFAFAMLGNWLDKLYPNKHNLYAKILTLLAIVIAFYNLNRQLKEINKMDE